MAEPAEVNTVGRNEREVTSFKRSVLLRPLPGSKMSNPHSLAAAMMAVEGESVAARVGTGEEEGEGD